MQSSNPFTDEQLQQKAHAGCQNAMDELLLRYSRLVKSCARPLFLAGGDGEDLIQEGMVGLLSAIASYVPGEGASFKTYAQICIRRRLLNAVSSAARIKHRPLNYAISLESLQLDERKNIGRELEDALLTKEQMLENHRQFSEILSGFEHEIFLLFLEGLSYEEMAKLVLKPVKSVDNAVQRIRKKLEVYFRKITEEKNE